MAVVTELESVEPWTCGGCGIFVYNTEILDGRAVPAPGAPAANFASDSFPRVCSMCKDMLDVVSSRRYFVDLQAKQAECIKRLRRND